MKFHFQLTFLAFEKHFKKIETRQNTVMGKRKVNIPFYFDIRIMEMFNERNERQNTARMDHFNSFELNKILILH